MQAAVVNVLGQAPRYQSFPDPVAGEGEALIQVRAAGLHPVVKAMASGAHYSSDGEVPVVPGVDGVGMLEDGSRVYFAFVRKPWGTMAERAVAPRSMCIPVPDGLDDVRPRRSPIPECRHGCSMKERARAGCRRDGAGAGRDRRCRPACHPGGAASGSETGDRRGPKRGGHRRGGCGCGHRAGQLRKMRCARPLPPRQPRAST